MVNDVSFIVLLWSNMVSSNMVSFVDVILSPNQCTPNLYHWCFMGSAIWWLQKPVIMLEGFDKLILWLLSEVLPIFFYRLIMFLLCKDNSAGFLWYCCAVVNTIVLLYSTKSKFRVYANWNSAYRISVCNGKNPDKCFSSVTHFGKQLVIITATFIITK